MLAGMTLDAVVDFAIRSYSQNHSSTLRFLLSL